MLGLNLFIVGMEKSGTTSLADWLVSNKIAKYHVPGLKEPYSYALDGCRPASAQPGEVVLDASTGYAMSPNTLRAMPEHNTKIILCVRNYFERCYSAYTYYRTTCRKDASSKALLKSIPDLYQISTSDRSTPAESFLFEHFFKIYKIHAPVKSEAMLRQYYEAQAQNILGQSFVERIRYEIGFLLSRRQLPMFSVLSSSFLTYPLKNLLAKYRPQDILIVSVSKLSDPLLSKEFAESLTGNSPENIMPIPVLNSTNSDARVEFEKGELSDLKSYFDFDFDSFCQLIKSHEISTRFIDLEDLCPAQK